MSSLPGRRSQPRTARPRRHRLARRLGALGVVLTGCLVALLALATQASAHAVVVSSTPADGARLAAAPPSVSITFDEAVGIQLGYLRVVDATGARADVGTAAHPDGVSNTVSVGVKSGLGDGTYLVSWRVISDDSHPVAGSIRFVVGNGALGAITSSRAPTVSAAVSTALSSMHFLGFTGLAMLAGSWLVFGLWPAGRRRRPVRVVIWSGWWLALVGALGEYFVQGPYDSGASLWNFWRWRLQQATLHSSIGQLISVRILLLGLIGAALSAMLAQRFLTSSGWSAEAAVIASAGVIVTYAASGHSQSANPRWLAVLVDALHLIAASVWLGGLVLLFVAAVSRPAADVDPAEDQAELAAALPIFSRVAVASVLTLAITGTIQAWREVGVLEALWSTNYGRLVLAKIVLFGALVGLGYFARRHVQAAGAPVVSPVLVPSSHRADVGIGARHKMGVRSLATESVTGPATSPVGSPVTSPAASFVTGPATSPVGSPAATLAEGPAATLVAGPLASTVHRLRRTVITELVLGAVVLGLSGILISQPPGRAALATQRSKPKLSTVQVTSSSRAVIEVSPGKHGQVQVSVQLTGSIKAIKVTLSATLPAKQLGPLPIPLQASGPNSYSASDVLLPAAGAWQFALAVQTSKFDSTTALALIALS